MYLLLDSMVKFRYLFKGGTLVADKVDYDRLYTYMKKIIQRWDENLDMDDELNRFIN